MKLAAGDFAVWLIIAIIFGIAKMWTKFASSQPDDDEPTPPPVRPRPRRQPRPLAPPMPSPRPIERSVPPVVRPVIETTREAVPKDLREFIEQLTRPPQPKPVPPPPVAPPPVPIPAPRPPAPAPVAAKVAPQPPQRISPWVEALRDRNNLRNIIISYEIIGPPRGA